MRTTFWTWGVELGDWTIGMTLDGGHWGLGLDVLWRPGMFVGTVGIGPLWFWLERIGAKAIPDVA